MADPDSGTRERDDYTRRDLALEIRRPVPPQVPPHLAAPPRYPSPPPAPPTRPGIVAPYVPPPPAGPQTGPAAQAKPAAPAAGRHQAGVLDTSVVLDINELNPSDLPVESAITAITAAEIGAGLHTTQDPFEQAARRARLQAIEAFEPLPFDAVAARMYGQLVAHVAAAGEGPRPRRLDLMTAAIALANGLPLVSRHPGDYQALAPFLPVVGV